MRARSLTVSTTVVALALALLPSATATATGEARIVNGTPVVEAPWMAFIQFDGFACGGSLIHPEWVLTAGHCVSSLSGVLYGPQAFTVTIGRENLDNGADGDVRSVDTVVRHPDYDNSSLDNDMALLQLSSPVDTDVLRFVNATHTTFETPGTPATVMGYGFTQGGNRPGGGQPSDVLLSTDVDVRDDGACGGDPDTFCAGDLAGDPDGDPANDSCNGDSGGPLVTDDPDLGLVQIGLVSYGPADCGYTQGGLDAGGYSRLTTFEDFIHDEVGVLAYGDEVRDLEGSGGGTRDVEVSLVTSRVPTGGDADEVDLTTTADTATAGDDFVADQATVDLSTGSGTFDVTVVTDDVEEQDEVVLVTSTPGSPITLVRPGRVVLLNDDGNATPVASFDPSADLTVAEGDDLDVVVRLSRPALGGEQVTVTAGSSGQATRDLGSSSAVATFAADAETATATFRTIDDDVHEADEQFVLRLTSTDVGTVSVTATATLQDDDDLVVDIPTVQFDEGDGDGVAVVQLTSSTPAVGGETIRVRTQDRGATAGEDYVAVDTTARFEAGASVTSIEVPVIGDTRGEGVERIGFQMFGGDGATAGTIGRLVLVDDDHEVSRVAGDDRIATSLAASASRADDSSDVVYLASARSFPDALVATPLAHQDGAPLLLTEPVALDPRVTAEVERVLGDDGRVVLLGGPAAVSQDVEIALSDAGLAVERIAGENRFATAALVADRLDTVDRVFLATGRNFPDALAAGTAAAAKNGAILLTDDAVLPSETIAWLAASSATQFAVGGQAAAAAPDAVPIVGRDRHATAVLLALQFLPDTKIVGLASARNFPDALAGGVALAAQNGVLLLTEPTALPEDTEIHLLDRRPNLVVVLGGPAAVSDEVAARVADLLVQ